MSTEPVGAPPQPSVRDWQHILALLDTALELEPAAQPQWLASLAPEQAHLSPMLAQLLRARAEVGTGDFMRPPTSLAAASAAAAPPELAAQMLVGPYRLLREIGRGGMASVWLAMRADGLLDRQIALKLPHASWGGAAFADRMGRERNILASLTHPNIARLYDAGVAADGRPFLALEYVEGEAIDAYANAHALSVRERVALVVQVARAVAHAHARLVVHRDLKPSNILVDAQGQAHLLDFGIAKLIDAPTGDDAGVTAPTQMQGRALTPDYASPEQIRGDLIGTASDVYSLGVVLFELLAGARPYRLPPGLGAVALAEALAQAEAPRPSVVATDPLVVRQLKGDLDAIVARAICKASAERYATIDAFADDLERHLHGEPVGARPDSRWYRAERWVRRHKLETAVAAAIVVAVPAGAAAQAAVLTAIGAGAAVALWQMRVARRQAQVAQDEAARAAQVKDFVASIFTQAVPRAGRGGAVTAADLLHAAARRVETDLAGQAEVAAELGALIGASFNELGEVRAGLEWLPKVVQRCASALGATHPLTLQSRWRLVEAANSVGELSISGPLLPALLRDLRSTHPPEPALLASALKSQAFVDAKHGDEAAAVAAVNEAIEVATRHFGATSEDALSARAALSNTLIHFTRYTEALQAIEPALAPARAAFGARRPHPLLLVIERCHADALARNDRPRDAVVTLRQVLADQRALDVDETSRVRIVMTLLANALLLGAQLDEAEALLEQASALHERLTGGVNEEGIGLFTRRGLIRALRGDGADALQHVARADALAAGCRGEAEARTLERASVRMLAQATAGQTAQALATADAIEPSRERLPAQARVRVLRARALALRVAGSTAAARGAAEQALASIAAHGCPGIEHGLALAEAARCERAAGATARAEALFGAALATWASAQVDGAALLQPVQQELVALQTVR